MENLKPNINENINEYIYRLGNDKENKKISWSNISDNILVYYDKKLNKDYIRHIYYAMKDRDSITEKGIDTRILVVSDQHYPFNLPIDCFKDYVNKVDILIFNGDESDCQSLSKFSKKYRVPFADEMIGARQMIIDTIDYIKPKKVILNYGNHNERMINYFTDRIHDDLLQLMPQTNLDFIVDLGFWKHDHQNKSKTFYEPLVKVYENEGIEIEYTKNWWCKVGKAIFSHPKAFKSGILGTAEKSYLYYLQLGIEFDTLVLAHTHQLGMYKYGKSFLYESGSLCKEMSYANDGRLTRPQSNGFVYIVQDKDGNVMYDKSKLVCI